MECAVWKILEQKFYYLECQCSDQGSISFECDGVSGKCLCQENIAGDKCTECDSGYYGFPNCKGNFDE